MDMPNENELTQTYRSASNQELLELAVTYDSLTDEAQRALRAEFEHRGLEPPEVPDSSPDLEFQRLITVQQFRDLTDAQLAKGVLDSAGIPSYLRDENLVRMDWFYSNSIGGIRLQVREEDRASAEALLSQTFPEMIQADRDSES
jgi:hypothetical protein